MNVETSESGKSYVRSLKIVGADFAILVSVWAPDFVILSNTWSEITGVVVEISSKYSSASSGPEALDLFLTFEVDAILFAVSISLIFV